jgi:hypothetical protein
MARSDLTRETTLLGEAKESNYFGVAPPMSQLGHSLPKWAVRTMSGLPSLATELRTSLVVRLVPISEVASSVQLPNKAMVFGFNASKTTNVWDQIMDVLWLLGGRIASRI